MTQEEFNKLPNGIRFKDADKDCYHLNDDDCDEFEDCCECCTGNKYFSKKYSEGFMKQTYNEILTNMR